MTRLVAVGIAAILAVCGACTKPSADTPRASDPNPKPADPKAMLAQGYAAYYGEGVPLDLTKAETLLRDAQAHGVASNLCYNWVWGIGFKQDRAFALECFRLNQAHDWVAYMYAEGIGVKADRDRAIAYLKALPAAAPAPAPSNTSTAASRDEVPPRFIWSPDAHVDLTTLRQKLEAHETGSYYSPGAQIPSPCWYLADTTADSLQCMSDEVNAEVERTSIVERQLIARLATGPQAAKARDLVTTAHRAWDDFLEKEASFEGYLVAGGGTMALQLGSGNRLSTQEDRRKTLEQLLANSWPAAASASDLEAADRALNQTYNALRKEYSSKDWPEEYGDAKEQLREVQRVWITHRDTLTALVEAVHAPQPDATTIGIATRVALTEDRTTEMTRADKDARDTREGKD